MAQETLAYQRRPRKWVYGYTLKAPGYEGLIKVGETTRETVEERVKEQVAAVALPITLYDIVWRASAMRPDGSSFRDKDLHRALADAGVERVEGEWFRCDVGAVKAAYTAVYCRTKNEGHRTESFTMRTEQREAVKKTEAYFQRFKREEGDAAPRFLWNAKMRFGKTFATYQLVKAMGFKRVLILTFKPAVMSAWEGDLRSHIDFEGWTFIRRYTERGRPSMDVQWQAADKSRPIVCFGSLQDFLGVDRETGGIKAKNEWVHALNWDLVVFDEYHFGAWRERAQQLFAEENEDVYEDSKRDLDKEVRGNNLDERSLPITTDHYLFLSGTPFRMLTTGEFNEEAIYSWTYADEQRQKARHHGKKNPYAALPTMKLLTYRLPDEIRRIAEQGRNEFDLNTFFSATGEGKEARFVYEDEVGQWLDFIRGRYLPTVEVSLKANAKPPMPYSDVALMSVLQHTLWFLPDVAACEAMAVLLSRHPFFKGYRVVLCAGAHAGNGAEALEPLREKMENPLETRTITLSCGKLTTGVTVRPWGGVLMLRNLKSPETYFQAAFRAQSPWETTDEKGHTCILKDVCYVLDFAPNRALRQVADYSDKLTINSEVPGGADTSEQRVQDFIHFLPILYYNGIAMRRIDAGEVLDIATSGTSATLLARRWESALLVNVDNDTFHRVSSNPDAMEAIRKIEGLRNLNKGALDILINRTKEIKDIKRDSPKEKDKGLGRELSEEEKTYRSERKKIQESLIKFATRIPIFMYLTDDREHSLKEVIAQVETALFERVTGLTLRDFDLLLSLGLFNDRVMNAAVLQFKRYEDASLSYSGIDRHASDSFVGAWDTALART